MKLNDITPGQSYAVGGSNWQTERVVLGVGYVTVGRGWGNPSFIRLAQKGETRLVLIAAPAAHAGERVSMEELLALTPEQVGQFARHELQLNGWRAETVQPQQVVRPWAEHQAMKDAEQLRTEQRDAERAERRAASEEKGRALMQRLSDLDITGARVSVNGHGFLEVSIAPDALAQLLDLAERDCED
jgi:hypothetical protein